MSDASDSDDLFTLPHLLISPSEDSESACYLECERTTALGEILKTLPSPPPQLPPINRQESTRVLTKLEHLEKLERKEKEKKMKQQQKEERKQKRTDKKIAQEQAKAEKEIYKRLRVVQKHDIKDYSEDDLGMSMHAWYNIIYYVYYVLRVTKCLICTMSY